MKKMALLKKAGTIFTLIVLLAIGETLLFLLDQFVFLKYNDQIGFFKFIPTLIGFALFFKLFDIIANVIRLKDEDFLE